MITIPVPVSPPQPPSARERALVKWFPWCNERVAKAIRVARPNYPLIEGGKAQRGCRLAIVGRGGHAA